MYEDRQLACKDCGASFIFTAGEQEFYASKGLTNAPRRCAECRRAAKGARNESSSRGGYGGSADGGYAGVYDQSPRQMSPAVCAECGRSTEVPFAPRGDRPVYCSDCYAQVRGASYSGSR